jgi:multidrug efflux pump subunit AcrB
MIDSDRILAQQVGLTQRDVANSLLISLTGSGATTTNFWLNYKNGVSYQVVVQTQQYRVASLDELHRTPVAIAGQASPQLLSNLAEFQRTTIPLSLNHYNQRNVPTAYASPFRGQRSHKGRGWRLETIGVRVGNVDDEDFHEALSELAQPPTSYGLRKFCRTS